MPDDLPPSGSRRDDTETSSYRAEQGEPEVAPGERAQTPIVSSGSAFVMPVADDELPPAAEEDREGAERREQEGD